MVRIRYKIVEGFLQTTQVFVLPDGRFVFGRLLVSSSGLYQTVLVNVATLDSIWASEIELTLSDAKKEIKHGLISFGILFNSEVRKKKLTE